MRIGRAIFTVLAVFALVLSSGAASYARTNSESLSYLRVNAGNIKAEPPKPADPKADSDFKLGDKSDWTIMVFMNGMEDQKGEVDDAIKSMEEAGSTKEVKIIVEASQRNWKDDGKVWTGSKRLFIANEADGFKTATLQKKVQSSKDDWRNVTKFAVYVKKNFPAKHYMLVLWDHGGGLKPMQKTSSGQSDDNGNDADSASAAMNGGGEAAAVELGTALGKISKTLGNRKIDILALDAGNMADLAVETQLREHTKYIVAAQSKCFNLRYESFLGDLRQSPYKMADEVAKSMVQSYQKYYELASKEPTTLSAVRSDKLREFSQLLKTFTEKTKEKRAFAAIKKLEPFPFSFKDESGQANSDFKDLGDFAKQGAKAKKMSADLRKEFAQIQQRMKSSSVVIANGPTSEYKDIASGLSIYLPVKNYKDEFEATTLSKDTNWGEFAKKLTEKQQQPAGDNAADSSKNSPSPDSAPN